MSPSPELQEGQAVVLSCQLPTGIPDGTSYRWYRDGQPLQDASSATLHLAAVTPTQAGAYHCQAQAPGSATTSLAAPVVLHVSCKVVFLSWREGRPSPGSAPETAWVREHGGQVLTIPAPTPI